MTCVFPDGESQSVEEKVLVLRFQVDCTTCYFPYGACKCNINYKTIYSLFSS